MLSRTKKHLSPGLVLSLIALVVAVGGTTIAVAQKGGDNTLRTRLGGATTPVVDNVTLLPQAQNNGVSQHLVTCPSNAKLGAGVAIGGGVVDPRPPDNTRNFAPLAEKTDGPVGKSAWLFQFDNDTATELPVELRVLCTFSKLNTKRG